MSGGGGGSGEWRPNPKIPTSANPDVDPCNIDETTNLNSVDRNALSAVQVGTELSVDFEAGPPQRLVARNAQGLVVGSITSASMLQIIQCIQNGFDYEATVLTIRGAICQVRVHRV